MTRLAAVLAVVLAATCATARADTYTLVPAAPIVLPSAEVPNAGGSLLLPAGWTEALDRLIGEIADDLARPPAERLREGVRVVIAGPPNAGKSSLLNRLAGRDAAITSEIAGTTRDLVEAPTAICAGS